MDITTQFLIDFQVHAVASALGLPIPSAAAALIYGVTENDYGVYWESIEENLKIAVDQESPKPDVQNFLGRFQAGQKVLFIGDSITVYSQSYARLFHHLLTPNGVEVINRGYSGYTSTHGLELTYTQFLAHQPDWVFIKYGVNDCKRFGSQNNLVSLEEYTANITGIVEAFQAHTSAQIILLTPTLVIEESVNNFPDIMAMRLIWRNQDLIERGQAIQRIAARFGLACVDLTAVPPEIDTYLVDGLHPNALGQRRIFTHIIQNLRSLS